MYHQRLILIALVLGIFYAACLFTDKHNHNTVVSSKTIIKPSLPKDTSHDFDDGVQSLKAMIKTLNLEQKIRNAGNFPVTKLVIVIQVHQRLRYLEKLVESLSMSENIGEALVIFSHDVFDWEINALVGRIKFCKVMQIFYPLSLQTHAGVFPDDRAPNECSSSITFNTALKTGCRNLYYADIFGHYRTAKLSQIKLHWWWKLHFVFRRIETLRNYSGEVLFIEEDHYVAPDFMIYLHKLRNVAKKHCTECSFLVLGHHSRDYYVNQNKIIIQNIYENMGLAFNRSVFEKISSLGEHFCMFDDYNWDFSLHYLTYEFFKPQGLYMKLPIPRVWHIGICGTHQHGDTVECDPTKSILEFRNLLATKQKNITDVMRKIQVRTPAQYGGFGDPRDQALCLGIAA